MAKKKHWGKKPDPAAAPKPKSDDEKKTDAKMARRKGPIAPIYNK
jgi:hypothetical protein